MKKVQPVNLTSDEALVLQQIAENGEDDVIGLSRGLSMSRSQVAKQLDRLRAKKTRHHQSNLRRFVGARQQARPPARQLYVAGDGASLLNFYRERYTVE